MKTVLVSACLLGIPCRYDGRSVPCREVAALGSRCRLVPVCPEVLGGLSTPRCPGERVGDRVLSRDGADLSAAYRRGAEMALAIARENNADFAILKSKSPSCGCSGIYDGTFTRRLRDGVGVTAEVLRAAGFRCYTEKETDLIEL